jgi:PRTRC genetic system ThiF family protein
VGTYRIETSHIANGHQAVRTGDDATIVLVGCGGTGGFLAEVLCRLLLGRKARLFLVDPDRVEPHNVARQAFDRGNVGHFKAEVLARRLAGRFHREVGYSVLPYDRELHAQVFRESPSRLDLVIGAVDNAAARRAITDTLHESALPYASVRRGIWYLDCGNGRNAGQVLLGNATRTEELRGAFLPDAGVCRGLPAPSLQRTDLLAAPPEPSSPIVNGPDCAESVTTGDQGKTINQVVAAIAAGFVEKLLDGNCGWMAAYFDLDDGTLRCVPADPKLVAQLAGLHVNAVAPTVHAASEG